ncbi:hypothetical protein ACJIZ3_002911 [Penstemon smallii]|uniref:Mediator-associated protein 2 n=1 Tax=Penstemon smallii TaxID=265156 RepID=A0ABD3UBI1_9LAMI
MDAPDVPVETGYQPPQGFVEDKKDPLVDLELNDSTELWLIQWPINQQMNNLDTTFLQNTSDFDGQQVSLNLHNDGHLGTFNGSSGKSYEVVSYKSQGPEAVVFLNSSSEAKIAGKISRHVSLIHYPEPSELQRRNNDSRRHSQSSSAATSTMSGHGKSRNIQRTSGYSTPSSRNKSSVLSGSEQQHSKRSKKRRVDEQSRSAGRSGQESGKGNGAVTSTETKDHSEERKSKKKRKIES